MKNYIKSLISSLCLFGMFVGINPVSAATTNEIETVFNWAENHFPELFPNHQATQTINPWSFRFYPSTGIYVGVKDDDLYVLGGPWGLESPTFVGKMPNVLAQIQSTNGNGNVPACSNTAELPANIVITQSGNVVNVKTNGCIEISSPENANFCEPPVPSQPTGVSVLSTTNILSFLATGLTIDLPSVSNPLDVFNQDGVSSCVINAQTDAVNRVMNSDICFDVTNQFSSLSSIPGISVIPPIAVEIVSTSTSQQVPNCFATNATSIVDALTGEAWINLNGNFVSTNDLGTSF